PPVTKIILTYLRAVSYRPIGRASSRYGDDGGPVLNESRKERLVGGGVVVTAGAAVQPAAEQPARGEPGQPQALPAEVGLVGVAGGQGQVGHAAAARPGGPGLGQGQEPLQPQRPLQHLRRDSDDPLAAAAQL